MIRTDAKVIIKDIEGKEVTFSSFSLTNDYYTFDIWMPEKKYNEVCIRKDELENIFNVLENFTKGNTVGGFTTQDYDSPSKININSIDSKTLNVEFELTYPNVNSISLKMNGEQALVTLEPLKKALSLVDLE